MTSYYIFAALCLIYNGCYFIHCIKRKRVSAAIGSILLMLAIAAFPLMIMLQKH